MQGAHPFFTYTSEILDWRLGDAPSPAPWPATAAPQDDPGRTQARASRILRAARDTRDIVLLGLGTGALAAALADGLPADKFLTVLCPDPATARRLRDAGRLPWFGPKGQVRLVADTSRQALYCLPLAAGLETRSALVTANPEPCPAPERQALDWLRRMLAQSAPLPPAVPPAPAPPVTLAVLAKPGEPGLADFFAACAGLAESAVLCWDAAAVPPSAAGLAEALGMPARHLARPLGGDFAAQRNALLAACPPGWILTLDPDERPSPHLPALLGRLGPDPDCGAAYFPRLTLYPDAGQVKVGHGLWPDLQLRFFRNAPPARPRYVRPVHERLEGLSGRAVLALDAPLTHYNRLLADDRAVTAKLAAYDDAAGAPRHHLSPDYPVLPRAFFDALAAEPAQRRVLLPAELW